MGSTVRTSSHATSQLGQCRDRVSAGQRGDAFVAGAASGADRSQLAIPDHLPEVRVDGLSSHAEFPGDAAARQRLTKRQKVADAVVDVSARSGGRDGLTI